METDNGKTVRGVKSTSKQHGTLNLFAALRVAAGQIQTNATVLKRREEFLQFMDQIVAEAPAGRETHVLLILDLNRRRLLTLRGYRSSAPSHRFRLPAFRI